ncbi:hypothetical protein BDZ89DRAFT_1058441 [Hymenopellis radicata]|nr:hypothetical protein BDZ89DRAFT_1058441 [Hymenopellis radicata]
MPGMTSLMTFGHLRVMGVVRLGEYIKARHIFPERRIPRRTPAQHRGRSMGYNVNGAIPTARHIGDSTEPAECGTDSGGLKPENHKSLAKSRSCRLFGLLEPDV